MVAKEVEAPHVPNGSKPSQQQAIPPKESAKMSSVASGSVIPPGSSLSKNSIRSNRSGRGLILLFDRVAAAEYPDQNPEFSTLHSRSGGTAHSTNSGMPSAATTSRLVTPKKRLSSLVLDVGGRRWKNRRPIGRIDVIQHAISSGSTISALSSSISRPASEASKAKGMSDVASSILQESSKDARANHPLGTPRPPMMMKYQRSRFFRRPSRTGSYSAHSERSMDRSIMSSIVDDITPNDAADANDPGKGNIFTQPQQEMDTLKLGYCSGIIESLLTLAAPGEEMRRVVLGAIPLALGAMSEAVVRLITAGLISHYLGTEAMIAYLLVGLFVRLTSEELSGAIIDAASSFVQAALFSSQPNASFLAGQYVQHAIVLQLLLGVPLLVVWAIYMEDVVEWLVQSESVAEIARDYARVVVFYYLVQSMTRTCTVVFHICGHEHFESIIDFTTLFLQLVVVACVVSQVESSSLITVGYIQVLIGVAGAVAKLMFPAMRGWMKPFRKGIFGHVALWDNCQGFVHLCRAIIPLLLGTFLEYGEWEVLTLLLQSLGSAEVAAWAILGALWDILEALTEGIGEAAAIQVAFLLAAWQPERARRLANTVMYLAVIQSLIVTSILYMTGKYLAVLLTSDPTLQHFINNSIFLFGLANVTMSFSKVGWSLIGAQGRFRLATSVIFAARWLVTMPAAVLIIFVWKMDVDALGGSLVIGYATASCALTFIVLKSDWDRLASTMHEMKMRDGMLNGGGDDPNNNNENNDVDEDNDDENGDPFESDDSDDSSSEGFGFMTAGVDVDDEDDEGKASRGGGGIIHSKDARSRSSSSSSRTTTKSQRRPKQRVPVRS